MNARFVAIALSLALAGCGLEGTPLARDLGLQQRIISFYDGRAIENGASCPTAQMDTIVRAQVLEDTPAQTVMRLRYHFTDQGQGASSGAPTSNGCDDWGERTFTFAKRGDGHLDVVAMSGAQRQVGGG